MMSEEVWYKVVTISPDGQAISATSQINYFLSFFIGYGMFEFANIYALMYDNTKMKNIMVPSELMEIKKIR